MRSGLPQLKALPLQVVDKLQAKVPDVGAAGQVTVLPVLLSGVLPYVAADGLALEAFMAAQGDPQAGSKGDPLGAGGDQYIWAADHVEVRLSTVVGRVWGEAIE